MFNIGHITVKQGKAFNYNSQCKENQKQILNREIFLLIFKNKFHSELKHKTTFLRRL